MITLVTIIHVIACLGLIAIILVQRGRGGGFVEAFSGLDSVFGTKTSAFLTKSTSVLAITFFLTCLVLTGLSLKKSKSLMHGSRTTQPTNQTTTSGSVTLTPKPVTQEPASTAPVTAGQLPLAEKSPAAEQLPVSK